MAGEHGYKPKGQKPGKLPTYQDLLDEFNKRMERFASPPPVKPQGPSVEDMINELERRTGVSYDA